MKENEENKIKVETKKVMAYPKASNCEDNYELYHCLHCSEEYLSQGNKLHEQDFCPRHSDFQVCVWCGCSDKESNMIEVKEDCGFYCKECYCPKCIQCDERMDAEEKSQFCSKECYNEYWSDIMEDDYKDR
jgi:hypothetical protein